MAWLGVGAGAVLVAAVAVDLWLTVLHPSVRGPISYRVERVAWGVVRAGSHVSGRRAG
jgi:hypothetical protein